MSDCPKHCVKSSFDQISLELTRQNSLSIITHNTLTHKNCVTRIERIFSVKLFFRSSVTISISIRRETPSILMTRHTFGCEGEESEERMIVDDRYDPPSSRNTV